jgi:riboflavin kinase/FMN adenylyltransferase
MQYFDHLELFPSELAQTVVTVGNFDGVHLGHQKLIEQVVQKAASQGLCSLVLTFAPHPKKCLYPEKVLELLTTSYERKDLISRLGIDFLVQEPFNEQFSDQDAAYFFEEILVNRLRAHTLVLGHDFHFGKDRMESFDQLQELCTRHGLRYIAVEPAKYEGEIVSSSAIRHLLRSGEVQKAQKYLTRPFAYYGEVVHGEGRGRKLGVPTANLACPEDKLLLPFGVYAGLTLLQGKSYPSVIHVGIRPTVCRNSRPWIEAHLLDQDFPFYSSCIEVSFLERLRDEKKFEDIYALKTQIFKDLETTRAILRPLRS